MWELREAPWVVLREVGVRGSGPGTVNLFLLEKCSPVSFAPPSGLAGYGVGGCLRGMA